MARFVIGDFYLLFSGRIVRFDTKFVNDKFMHVKSFFCERFYLLTQIPRIIWRHFGPQFLYCGRASQRSESVV